VEAELLTEQRFEAARSAFRRTPPGRARVAFQRGDEVFQYALDVQSLDPNPALNAICREGWELVTGSFVSVMEGLRSEQAVFLGEPGVFRSRMAGYYLFRRCESKRCEPSDPF
jgi:hypothetical protein